MSTQRRTVVLLRHAKSEWPDGIPDDQRPLAERGRAHAPAAGRWLAEHVSDIDLVLCSPALRARQTWELAAAELSSLPRVREDDRLYGASMGDLLEVVHELPRPAHTVAVIGHNPGLSDFIALLCGGRHELKTAAIAVLSWRGEWSDAGRQHAELTATAKPRG